MMAVRAGIVLLLLVVAVSATAQVTVQMSDVPLVPGAVITRGMGPNDNQMTAAGPDQSWDFTSSLTVVDVTETYDDPEGHYGADSFPEADLVYYIEFLPGAQQLIYFDMTPNTYCLVGAAYYYNNEVTVYPADVTGVNATFPLNYGDEWDLVSITEDAGVTTVDSSHYQIDAWGTLHDFVGTFDCLRLRNNRTTTEYPGAEVETRIEYFWFAPGYGEVVSVWSDHNEDNPQFSDGTFYRVSEIAGWVGVDEQSPATVTGFTLQPAWPNPFNGTTTLNLTISTAGTVDVLVFNSLGQQVARLAGGHHAPGEYSIPLDARSLSSGTYFVRATAADQVRTQRIVLLK